MKLYKYDMHVHTSQSSECGQVNAKQLVKEYQLKGYRGMVVTDHYNKYHFDKYRDRSWKDQVDFFLKGYRLAREAGRDIGFNVLLGMELRFEPDPEDFLVYGFDESFLYKNRDLFMLSLEAFRSLTRHENESDILIYQAHPFRKGQKICDISLVDGIEIKNENSTQNSHNDLAEAYARKHQLDGIGGSDIHIIDDVGKSGISFKDEIRTETELVCKLQLKEYEII